MRGALAVVVLAACHPASTPKNTKPPEAGVSIAIYERDGTGYSVVDDRRWIDHAGSTLLLANIDPGADLASLVIEPTSRALHIGSCTRERLPDAPVEDALAAYAREEAARAAGRFDLKPRPPRFDPAPPPAPPPPAPPPRPPLRYAPIVRCDVDGPPGTYLVRVLYVSTTLRYRAQHDLDVREPTHATVVSRFAIATPPWRERADVVLFDGVPGGDNTPQEITRGSIELDGAVAVLAAPPREVSAEVRRVYDGAILSGEDPKDPQWGRDSSSSVWAWLELANTTLAPGPVHVHLDLPGEDVRDSDVGAGSRKQADTPRAPLRLPLWIDQDLRATRMRTVEYSDGKVLVERLVVGIGNTGEVPREVFIEEHLRPAPHRKIDRAWPKKPAAAPPDMLRSKVVVQPGHVMRIGYTLEYRY